MGKLTLSIKKGEKVFIGHSIVVEVMERNKRIQKNASLQLSIEAPNHVKIFREKLYKAKYDAE